MRFGILRLLTMILTYSIPFGATCAQPVLDRLKRLTGDDTFNLLLDTQTIVLDGTTRRAWIIWDYKSPQKLEGDPSVNFSSSKMRWIIDCKNQLAGLAAVIHYDGQLGDGKLVYEKTAKEPSMDEIVPLSIGETIARNTCSAKKK